MKGVPPIAEESFQKKSFITLDISFMKTKKATVFDENSYMIG
jgi:hypothetical protein